MQPILSFTFAGGSSSRQGVDFLKEIIFNMFLADPQNAIQDVMEVNFGFEIESVAGVTVENFKKPNEKSKEEAKAGEDSKSEQAKAPDQVEGESSALKQEELRKKALLEGANRIYKKQNEFSPLLAQ